MSQAIPLANSSKSESENEDDEDDEDQWSDAEPDEDTVEFRCLYDDESFNDVNTMLIHCTEQHGLDFVATVRSLNLEFYQAIKLVNFIRSEVQNGNQSPDISSIANFEDESFLKPVIESDALLFTLDEILQLSQGQEIASQLSFEKLSAEDKIAHLQDELSQVKAQYMSYKQSIEEIVDARWNASSGTLKGDSDEIQCGLPNNLQSLQEKDYFKSYGYLDIHDLMLKDKIRTESYRDFIYDNKNLFKDKIVLDVGCGTGILSMFCARAGAKHVYAVDNADILDKAREIIYENKLADKISCLRGKIEEVSLPVASVDIIVSEWMGYCLQFEAMLDSIIWARDKYLKSPGGLVVPSHCTLRLAPIVDSDCATEDVDFWHDVYGFNMTPLLEEVYDSVAIRRVLPEDLAAPSIEIFRLPIQTVKIEELDFTSQFRFRFKKDAERLDGWVMWFDTFFLPSTTAKLPSNVTDDLCKSLAIGSVAFTTGPMGPETHWKSGVMMIKHDASDRNVVKEGQIIEGNIKVSKGRDDKRSLDISIGWKDSQKTEKRSQIWRLR